jgi:hypothetical protein
MSSDRRSGYTPTQTPNQLPPLHIPRLPALPLISRKTSLSDLQRRRRHIQRDADVSAAFDDGCGFCDAGNGIGVAGDLAVLRVAFGR